MISKYINALLLVTAASVISSCSSSSGSAVGGTQVTINARPSPAVTLAQPAGNKTFTNDLGDSITLTRAYIVISNATIESTCGVSFSAAAEQLLNFIIPQAQAHTSSTPTSIGDPVVVDLLYADNESVHIGTLSPPAETYCGVSLNLLAADADAINLPEAAGTPNMVGKSVYIEGSFILAGGGSGNILISTGAALSSRHVLLPSLMQLSANNLSASAGIMFNYDSWFNAIDLALLETETAAFTDLGGTNVNQLLINIGDSIHSF